MHIESALYLSGLAQLLNQTLEDYRGRFELLRGLLLLICPPSKNYIHPE